MVGFQQLCTLSWPLLKRVHCSPFRVLSELRAHDSKFLRTLSLSRHLDRAVPCGKIATGACARLSSVPRFQDFKAQTVIRCFSDTSHLQPLQDLVIFKHHRPRFFRLLALFCLGQGVFWAYLGQYGFSSLRDTEKGVSQREIGNAMGKKNSLEESSVMQTGVKKLNLGSKLWRYGFTLACFTMGSLIVAAGYLFMQRSVSQVLLHRGGKLVTIWTSAPFGSGLCFTVPLQHISCMAHRSEVPSMIPLKIKSRPLYFLLDKQGQVFNAKLFDITIGTYRKL